LTIFIQSGALISTTYYASNFPSQSSPTKSTFATLKSHTLCGISQAWHTHSTLYTCGDFSVSRPFFCAIAKWQALILLRGL
jgi:hypothetical protein